MTTAPSLSRGRLGRRLWPQKAHLWSTTPGWLMVRPEEGSGSHGGGEPFLRVSSGACMCVTRFQGTEVSPVLCFEKTQRLKRPQETGLLSASRIPLILCFPSRNFLQPIRRQGTLSYVCSCLTARGWLIQLRQGASLVKAQRESQNWSQGHRRITETLENIKPVLACPFVRKVCRGQWVSTSLRPACQGSFLPPSRWGLAPAPLGVASDLAPEEANSCCPHI